MEPVLAGTQAGSRPVLPPGMRGEKMTRAIDNETITLKHPDDVRAWLP